MRLIYQTVILLVFGLLLTLEAAQAKEYHIVQLDIVATIQEDGSIRFTETRAFAFTGSFSWVTWSLPLRGFSELRDVSAYDNDIPLSQSTSEEPGTFNFTQNRNRAEIKWHFEAKDERRDIRIEYTLDGALSVDQEWTEFFWNFIGRGWERPTSNISITVEFPENVSSEFLHFWSETGLENESFFAETGKITYTTERVRARRALPLRIVFPTSLINKEPKVVASVDPFAIQAEYDRILREAEEAAAFRARVEPIANIGAFILIFLSFGITIYVLLNYGRHATSGRRFVEEYDAPPTDTEPALVGWLLFSRIITSHHLVATILDLSRRGYYKIRHEKSGKNSLFSTEKDEFYLEKSEADESKLNSWEKKLYSFINSRIGIGKDSFSKLFDYGSGSDKGYKWVQEWNKAVAEDAKSKGWFTYQPKVILVQIGVQLVILALAILSLFWTSVQAYAIAAIVACLFGFFACFFLYPRTETGQEFYEKWRSYYKNLKAGQISKDSEYQAAHIVYAVNFGISGKKFQTLTSSLKFEENEMTWLILMPGMTFNPATITGAVNSMNTTLTTTVSTGTGAVSGSAGGGSGGGAG